MNAPLVPITLAFLAGILVAMRLPCSSWSPWAVLGTGVAGAAAAIGCRARSRAGLLALLALWLCLGMLRAQVWQGHPEQALQAFLPEEPEPVRLHGVVVTDPIGLFEPSEPARQTCVLALRHVGVRGAWEPRHGRIRVTLQDPRVWLAYGDEVLLEGDWSRVGPPGNPGQYDWRSSLARSRIHGTLLVKPFDAAVILRHEQGHPVLAWALRLRRRWDALIRTTFDEPHAGLLLSFLLGQRVSLDPAIKDAFVETGTVHLLVISGFNVGLIALGLELLLRLVGLGGRARLVLCAAMLGGYALVTGLAPPVVRATLMAWVVLGGAAWDRVVSWPNTLAAAALVMSWVDPMQLVDPGFQLSFGAVLSLLVFTSRWIAWLEPRLAWMRPAWLRRYVAVSLCTTSAIWVGLSPILAWYFHLVAPVSMLANLLIAPLMSVLIGGGTGVLLVGTVFADAVRWSEGALRLVIDATLAGVTWCHRLPGGYWYVGHPSTLWLAGYYGLLAVSVGSSAWAWRVRTVRMAWLAGLAIWIWSAVALRALETRWLRVDVLDVGHGDSILVRTPRGQTLLVDAGSEEAGRYRVVPLLRFLGANRLDALFLTHWDEDHVGGAVALLEALTVRRLLTNGSPDARMGARAIRQLAARRAIPETAVAAGTRLVGDPDVLIDVLHPPRGLVPGAVPASNDNSIVLRLRKGVVTILLTGDLEEAGIPWLLAQEEAAVRATVLKVPHHGSRLGAAGEQFFRAVTPRVAILSVGRLHHLPAPETVRALEAVGALVYSTRDHGAIHLRTDGRQLDIKTFRGKSKGKSKKEKAQFKIQNFDF